MPLVPRATVLTLEGFFAQIDELNDLVFEVHGHISKYKEYVYIIIQKNLSHKCWPKNLANFHQLFFILPKLPYVLILPWLERNKMVNSSNGPAAKLLVWSADRILFNITKN